MPRRTGRAAALVFAPVLSTTFMVAALHTSHVATQNAALPRPRPTTTTAAPVLETTTSTTAPAPTTTAPPTTAAPVVATPPTTQVTAPAPAPIATVNSASLTIAERGGLAVGMLNYPYWATHYRIIFQGPRAGILGVTDNSVKTITIYIRAGQSTASIARVLAHELGHAVDFELTSWSERAQYMAIRGFSSDTSWYPCDMCEDYASPAGDFAEVFAYWQLGPGDFRSMIGAAPSQAELDAIAPIFTP